MRLVSGRAVFGPAAGRIGRHQAVDEISDGGVLGVGPRAGFHVPQLDDIGPPARPLGGAGAPGLVVPRPRCRCG